MHQQGCQKLYISMSISYFAILFHEKLYISVYTVFNLLYIGCYFNHVKNFIMHTELVRDILTGTGYFVLVYLESWQMICIRLTSFSGNNFVTLSLFCPGSLRCTVCISLLWYDNIKENFRTSTSLLLKHAGDKLKMYKPIQIIVESSM